jgi:putative ABC transport system ATP-binding protein
MPICFSLCHGPNNGWKPLFYLEDSYDSPCGGDEIMEPIIRTEKVDKFYYLGRPEEVRALNQVALEIFKNRIVLLRGPSGSGKTTLLNLISTIDRPTKGRIFLFGEDISKYSDVGLSRIRQKRIGLIFQSFHLLPRLSAWENVAFPLLPLGIAEKERRRRSVEILIQLKLEKRVDHAPEQMSGGEQQRVAIARALINDPEIIMADEPTSNIDAESVKNLLEIFSDLKRKGKTIIVSSHDPIFLDFSETIFFLKDGNLMKIEEREKP